MKENKIIKTIVEEKDKATSVVKKEQVDENPTSSTVIQTKDKIVINL